MEHKDFLLILLALSVGITHMAMDQEEEVIHQETTEQKPLTA